MDDTNYMNGEIEVLSEQAVIDEQIMLMPYHKNGRLLIIAGQPMTISSQGGAACFKRHDSCIHRTPWMHLDGIILFGRHHLSSPAICDALSHDVPIHLATSSGYYRGMIFNPRCAATGAAWMSQYRLFEDEEVCLQAAKNLVDARIRHMREMLRRRKNVDTETARKTMKISLHAVSRAMNRSALNGVEGHATRVYFDSLKFLVPKIYGFKARNRRPPCDPFNALISLGYTQLYARVDSMLRAIGLLPELGFYHQQRSGHAALASDLMEPFRHVIERCALDMLQRKSVSMDDFTYDDVHGCRMVPAARRVYAGMIEEAMFTKVKVLDDDASKPLLEQMFGQCMRVKKWIAGESDRFEAWRMR